MRRGSLTMVAMIAVTALALAGCSSQPGEDGQTIRLQVSGEPEETAVYDAMAELYMSEHEGTRIEVIKVPEKDDHLALLQTSFGAGDPPEVFLINYREYAPFFERGAIDPVGPYLAERDVDLADYFPQPVEAFTLDDELQCMPQNVSSLVVYFNTELFEQAGIPAPYDGWTFEEFRAAAKQLTTADVRGVYVEPSLIRLAPFAWSNGGQIVDDRNSPTSLTLDDPATTESLQALIDLHRVDDVMPTEEELAAQDAETRFVTGKLAMILSSRKDTPSFREVRSLAWDVAPLPTFGGPSTILHSDAYCLSAGSKASEAAADFVAFAVGQQGQTLSALSGRTVPSLRSVAESGAFLDPSKPPAHSGVFTEAVAHMDRTPVIAGWPEIEDIASELLTRAFYEPGADLDRLLDELDRRTATHFETR